MNTRLIKTLKQVEELLQTASNLDPDWNAKNESDIRLLAETDRLHNGLNGPAIKKICERAYQRGDHRYERLAGISISHLYNLRQSKTYQTVPSHALESKAESVIMRRQNNFSPPENRCLKPFLNERPEITGLRSFQAHFRIGKYCCNCSGFASWQVNVFINIVCLRHKHLDHIKKHLTLFIGM